jgi:beta-lactamase regulating signal transducer with metallopeptidase domain
MSFSLFSTPAVAGWMLYTTIVGCLIVIAAIAAHDAERTSGRPLRWIWAACIGIIIALSVAAPIRGGVASSVDLTTLESVREASPAAAIDAGNDLRSWVSDVRGLAIAPLQLALHRAQAIISSVPAAGFQVVALLWLAVSTILIAGFVVSYRRMTRHVRHAVRAKIGGVPVRVSPTIGPAVVGLFSSEIVVPDWLRSRPVDEQEIAVAHEMEHVRAADPWMLIGACAAVALMPWNPALWYCLSRLRLTVEIDCDRRVLRRGVSVNNYGSLLIDMSASQPRLHVAMPAFPDSHSHLERRLIAMTERPVRFTSARRIAGSMLAATVLITACESRLPTSADLEQMDVKAAERQAEVAGVLKATRAEYLVDGNVVDARTAMEMKASEIGSISVTKGGKSAPDEIRITTVTGVPLTLVPTRRDNTHPDPAPSRVALTQAKAKSAFTGLVVIDGVLTTPSALNAISPERIASMEVLKSAAATRKYSDPRAVNGVIIVTTKK